MDVAIRYVVVDAIDDQAARFYQHYGFRDTSVAGRLLRKVSDIEADLAMRQWLTSVGALPPRVR